MQNFPLFTSITTGATTHVQGVLHSKAATLYDPRLLRQRVLELSAGIPGGRDLDRDDPDRQRRQRRRRVRRHARRRDRRGAAGSRRRRRILSATRRSSPRASPSRPRRHRGRRPDGTTVSITGTDLVTGLSVAVGGQPGTNVNVTSATHMSFHTPALSPGTASDIVVTNPDGTFGTLVKAFVCDFTDVPPAQQFHSYVTTLVSNGITAGVGGGLLRRQRQHDAPADGRLPHEGEARPLLHPAAVHDPGLHRRALLLGVRAVDQRARRRGHHRRLRQRDDYCPDGSRQARSRWPSSS